MFSQNYLQSLEYICAPLSYKPALVEHATPWMLQVHFPTARYSAPTVLCTTYSDMWKHARTIFNKKTCTLETSIGSLDFKRYRYELADVRITGTFCQKINTLGSRKGLCAWLRDMQTNMLTVHNDHRFV